MKPVLKLVLSHLLTLNVLFGLLLVIKNGHMFYSNVTFQAPGLGIETESGGIKNVVDLDPHSFGSVNPDPEV